MTASLPGNHLKKRFYSSSELAAWFEAQPRSQNEREGWSFSSDARTVSRGLDILRGGDETNLAKAQDLLSQFQESIHTPRISWEHDVAGAFPDVGAMLAGLPEHMLTQQPDFSDHSPVRVYVGLTSSAGITREQLAQRGSTIAAFAIALSERRPVFITPYVVSAGYSYNYGGINQSHSGEQTSFIAWDIATSPLVLSELMGCLSSPEVTRYLGLAATYRLNGECYGGWPSWSLDEALLRDYIGAQPDDLVLPSIHLYDPMLQDPIGWLKSTIARYTADIEEAY